MAARLIKSFTSDERIRSDSSFLMADKASVKNVP